MCAPSPAAHTTVRASPSLPSEALCPVSNTIPKRLSSIAPTMSGGIRTLNRVHAVSGAKTTKSPVMSPELVGVVYRSPHVWKEVAHRQRQPDAEPDKERPARHPGREERA